MSCYEDPVEALTRRVSVLINKVIALENLVQATHVRHLEVAHQYNMDDHSTCHSCKIYEEYTRRVS